MNKVTIFFSNKRRLLISTITVTNSRICLSFIPYSTQAKQKTGMEKLVQSPAETCRNNIASHQETRNLKRKIVLETQLY